MGVHCLACGDIGDVELLVYCSQCKACAEHRYCLDKIPKSGELPVLCCEDCQPNGKKLTSVSQEPACAPIQGCHSATKDDLSFSLMHSKEIAELTGALLEKEVENGGHVTHEDKEFRRPRRRLILPDDDELDNEFDSKIAENNLAESREYIIERAYNDINLKRRRLILDDEDFDQSGNGDHDFVKSLMDSRTSVFDNGMISCRHGDEDENLNGCRKLKRRRVILDEEDLDEYQCRDLACISDPESDLKELMTNCGSGPEVQASMLEAHKSELNPLWHQGYQEQSIYSCARPILDVAWRGCFDICDEKYGPITAHLSDRASDKVCSSVRMFPRVLKIEKVPKLVAWPKSFMFSPPTDDKIGLFFFPESAFARVEDALDQLVDDIINKDLMLKVTFDHVELLIFTSVILPADLQRFRGKFYLWGAFRGRQVPLPTLQASCAPKLHWHKEHVQQIEGTEHREEKSQICVLRLGSASVSPTSGVTEMTSDVGASSESLELLRRQVPGRTIRAKCPSKLKIRVTLELGKQIEAAVEIQIMECEEELEEGEIRE